MPFEGKGAAGEYSLYCLEAVEDTTTGEYALKELADEGVSCCEFFLEEVFFRVGPVETEPVEDDEEGSESVER